MIYKGSDDLDEDEDRPRIALPFNCSGEPLDEDHVPTTGDEYLRKVHQEARNCPQVLVASIDPLKLRPSSGVIPRTPSDFEKLRPLVGFEPSIEWQLEQVSLFSEVRQRFAFEKQQRISRNPRPKPDEVLSGISRAEEWLEKIENETIVPLVSIVTLIPGARILQLICWHTELIQRRFTAQQGRWLFALLAALEKPLSPEACDSIRALARAASKARAAIGDYSAGPSQEDTAEVIKHREHITALNLIICLVSRYFSQTDLAD